MPLPRTFAHLMLPCAALALWGGCEDAAPAQPTWADVAPVLAAQCVRCHGAPAIGGAPTTFRLDRYDDTVSADGIVLGAASMAEWIATRTSDGSMPPRFPLADHDVDLLTNWFNLRPAPSPGVPFVGPPRGAPRAGNQPPRMTVAAQRTADGIEVSYELRDPDRDLVVGDLQAVLGNVAVPLGEVHSGRGTLLLDTALLAAGSYDLIATLDDGAGAQRRTLGDVEVTPPRPAPPRLGLRAPAQGDYVAAAELPLVVDVRADDVDTQTLTVTVSLIDDRAPEQPIDRKIVTVAAGSTQQVALGGAATPAGLTYRVVAEVSDGVATHRAAGGRFRISRETTTDTFTTIANEVFAAYCLQCHTASPRTPNVTLDLSTYRGTVGAPGAYDVRRRIFQRAVVSQSMPPGSARLTGGEMPAAVRDRLARWLLAGAPE
jgi:hypothetical protein